MSSDSAVLGDTNCDHSIARSGEPCWLGEACDPNVGALVCDDDRHIWRGNLARTSCN